MNLWNHTYDELNALGIFNVKDLSELYENGVINLDQRLKIIQIMALLSVAQEISGYQDHTVSVNLVD